MKENICDRSPAEAVIYTHTYSLVIKVKDESAVVIDGHIQL